MLTRFAQWQGREPPSSVAADATYGNGEFLQWLQDRGITPYMRTRDSARRKNNRGYGPERLPTCPRATATAVRLFVSRAYSKGRKVFVSLSFRTLRNFQAT
jgi:hypothetical protein